MSPKDFHWNHAENYFRRARRRMRTYANDAQRNWSEVRAGRVPKIGAVLASLFGLAGLVLWLLLTTSAIASIGMVTGFLAVFLGPPVWVFIDSDARGLSRPFAWALFALFAPVIGTVIYLLVRPDKEALGNCDGCGREVSLDFAICPFCGTGRSPSRHTCPSCYSEISGDWSFCPFCRQELVEENTSSSDVS